MSNISYLRAGMSCLPFVGLFVDLYNVRELKNEESSVMPRLEEVKGRLTVLVDSLPAALWSGKTDDEVVGELKALKVEFHEKGAPHLEKDRIYSLCGAAGDIFSIATTVALVALKIFSPMYGIFLGVLFTASIGIHTHRWYQNGLAMAALDGCLENRS